MSVDVPSDLDYCHNVLNSCWETEDAKPLEEIGYTFGGPFAYPNEGFGPCARSTDCIDKIAPVVSGYSLVAGAVLTGAIIFAAPVISAAAVSLWAFSSIATFVGFADAARLLHNCIYAT